MSGRIIKAFVIQTNELIVKRYDEKEIRLYELVPGSTAMLLKRCKNISEMLRKHFQKMFYLREFVWF